MNQAISTSMITPTSTRKPVPNPKALRLVSTKDLSRDEWLNVRKQGIGSSDAAAAVGLIGSWIET